MGWGGEGGEEVGGGGGGGGRRGEEGGGERIFLPGFDLVVVFVSNNIEGMCTHVHGQVNGPSEEPMANTRSAERDLPALNCSKGKDKSTKHRPYKDSTKSRSAKATPGTQRSLSPKRRNEDPRSMLKSEDMVAAVRMYKRRMGEGSDTFLWTHRRRRGQHPAYLLMEVDVEKLRSRPVAANLAMELLVQTKKTSVRPNDGLTMRSEWRRAPPARSNRARENLRITTVQ